LFSSECRGCREFVNQPPDVSAVPNPLGLAILVAKIRGGQLASFRRDKVAFSNYALVLFAGTLDSIFELAPTVRKLFGHLVGSARHVTTYDGPEVYDLTDLEFM
jgi:hypothetical protein